MRKYVNKTEAQGKTVLEIRESEFEDAVAILYTDETYTGLETSFESAEMDISDLYYCSDCVLEELAIITPEELKERSVKKQIEKKEELMRGKRAKYEELKKLFEPEEENK